MIDMDLERQKENFKNHIATLTDYGNIKVLDFANPNSSHYRIRFLFEEDYCRLHISSDLGELIATNYNNMTFNKFADFVNNTGYFEEKVDCHNRAFYYYDEDVARQKLKEYFEEYEWLSYTDKKEDIICEKQKVLKAVEDDISEIKAKLGIE